MAMEGLSGEMAMDFRVAAGGGLEPPGLEPELELEPPQLERRRAKSKKAASEVSWVSGRSGANRWSGLRERGAGEKEVELCSVNVEATGALSRFIRDCSKDKFWIRGERKTIGRWFVFVWIDS